jgi:polyhydroxyalkanoate synthase
VLLGAPLNFGPSIGAFGALVAAAPLAVDVAPSPGNIPGSLISTLSVMAAPHTFGWSRLMDFAASTADSEALARCLAVERWALDERPIARKLFADVWEKLFRENGLMRGTLRVGRHRVRPEDLSTPLLAIVDAHCSIAPPAAVLPFVEAAGSVDKQVLWYAGDSGVSLRHVGMLIGRNAHRRLWPKIETWMRERHPSAGRSADS